MSVSILARRCSAPAAVAFFLSASFGLAATTTAFANEVYSTSSAGQGAFSAPASEARPGEYYFYLASGALARKQYTFAAQMFAVAASWAFKPAEYNLGVMYFNGEGVAKDPARGMAWMALAAERGEADYVEAREQYYALLDTEQFEHANTIWRELKKTYGDEVALKRAKARWKQVRNSATGSHLGAVGNLVVGAYDAPKGDPMSHRVDTATFAPAGITGGFHVDGSQAYNALRATDDPYDPRFYARTGTVKVGKLIPAGTQADPGSGKVPPPQNDADGGETHFR